MSDLDAINQPPGGLNHIPRASRLIGEKPSPWFNVLAAVVVVAGIIYSGIHLANDLSVVRDTRVYPYILLGIALLIAAILWNLATWYFGLPSSSSHTLIGSIIGVGLMNQLMAANPCSFHRSRSCSPAAYTGCCAILCKAAISPREAAVDKSNTCSKPRASP